MSLEQLKKFVDSDNIADELDSDQLNQIGQRCLHNFEEDYTSMSEWLNTVKKVIELAGLVGGPKNYPLPNSSNVKFPLVTKACSEFSSRVYPEIIKDGKIVRARVIGKDPYLPTDPRSKAALAERVTSYMNYQLLEKNEEWELQLDRLLTLLSLIGFVCTKTYYDPIKRYVCSDLCNYEDLIVHSDCKSLCEAPRVSHILHLRMNDLISAVRADLFLEDPITELLEKQTEHNSDMIYDIVEQHCYLDLDDDDYQEPYIVSFLKETGKILRIKARFEMDQTSDQESENSDVAYKSIEIKKGKIVSIKPTNHFTDYHFLVNPKGKFHSIGFGTLMFGLNNAINTLLNELIDAGNLRNLQGGFIDSRFNPVATGEVLTRPGQFIKLKAEGVGMKLSDGVMPFNYNEPSDVLFKLMGTLVASGEKLSSSTEIMTGGANPENNKTGATQALIQEGQKVHTAILKRIYRSLTDNFRKIFHLNGQYLDPHIYQEVIEGELTINQNDFDETQIRILPVADPNLGSEAQRAQKIQMLAGIQQLPGVNPIKITQRIVMGLEVENPQELLADPKTQQKPDPEMLKIQGDLEERAQLLNIKGRELDLEEKKVQLQALEIQSNIILNRAKALQSVALADQAKSQSQTDQYDTKLKAIQLQLDHMMDLHQFQVDQTNKEVEQDQNQQSLDQGQQEVDQNEQNQDQPESSGDMDGESSQ